MANQQHRGSTMSGAATQEPRQNSGGGQSLGATAQVAKAKQQVTNSAQSAADALREQGEGFFAEQKSKAAGALSSVSSAIRDVAQKLRGNQSGHTAQYADMAADQLDGVARFIGDHNLGSLLSEAERAARRRPELFLGGMFLVGLGVSRFLKASSQSGGSRDWPDQGSR